MAPWLFVNKNTSVVICKQHVVIYQPVAAIMWGSWGQDLPTFWQCGGPYVLGPPHFYRRAAATNSCSLTSYSYWSCYVTIWIIISSGTTLRPASLHDLHVRSICHWLVSSYPFPGTCICAPTAVGPAAVPRLPVYTPVAAAAAHSHSHLAVSISIRQ